MSCLDYRGAVYAFAKLMQLAQQDCAQGGEVKPARVIWAESDGRERGRRTDEIKAAIEREYVEYALAELADLRQLAEYQTALLTSTPRSIK